MKTRNMTWENCRHHPEDGEIVFRYDLSGNVTFLNPRGESLWGYSQAEACRMNIAQLVAPEMAEIISRPVAICDGLGSVYEIEIVSRDGRRVPLEVSTEVVFRKDRPAEIQGIAVLWSDPSDFDKSRLRCLDPDFMFLT